MGFEREKQKRQHVEKRRTSCRANGNGHGGDGFLLIAPRRRRLEPPATAPELGRQGRDV